MTDQNVIESALNFAIGEEEAAATFYTYLAQKMDKAWMKQVFEGFAKEELGHKAKLVAIKEGKKLLSSTTSKITDLKIADYMVDVDTSNPDDLDYQQALIIAMKKEKAAFRLYSDLAESTTSEEIKELFLGLAQEEAKHKLRFEVEYDENILTEN